MKTKLTLTIEDSVKKRAKQLSRREGISISRLVEQFLKDKTEEYEWTPQPGSWTEKLTSIAPKRKDFDYKKEKEQAVIKKYRS